MCACMIACLAWEECGCFVERFLWNGVAFVCGRFGGYVKLGRLGAPGECGMQSCV